MDFRELRTEVVGMTQDELADDSGVHRRQIIRIENGEVDTPHKTTVKCLALSLGVREAAVENAIELTNKDDGDDD